MAKTKTSVTVAAPNTDTAKCPHCNKSVHVDHTDKVEVKDINEKPTGDVIRPAHTYNAKTHMPGWFCEHCDKPLDMTAVKSFNPNYGDEASRKNLVEDITKKVKAFQESL